MFRRPQRSPSTELEVVTATDATLQAGCATWFTAQSCLDDPAALAPGVTRFYLVRSLQPFAADWGVDSSGSPRAPGCGS